MLRYCQMIGFKLYKSPARRLPHNNILFFSSKMETEKSPSKVKYAVNTDIKLNDNEKELFKLFTDFVKEKEVKTVIRVAGGWVRDKVTPNFPLLIPQGYRA